MFWQYVLNVRVGDNVIYKRDLYEKEATLLDNEENLLDKNNLNCEIISNVEVSKHARKC